MCPLLSSGILHGGVITVTNFIIYFCLYKCMNVWTTVKIPWTYGSEVSPGISDNQKKKIWILFGDFSFERCYEKKVKDSYYCRTLSKNFFLEHLNGRGRIKLKINFKKN